MIHISDNENEREGANVRPNRGVHALLASTAATISRGDSDRRDSACVRSESTPTALSVCCSPLLSVCVSSLSELHALR